MKTTIRTAYIIFVMGLVFATQAFAADVSNTVSFGNFQLISKTRVDRFNYDYVYKLDANNSGAALTGVTATLTNAPQGTAFLDAQVSFGDLATKGKTTSTDTFSFRQDRRFALAPENLAWQVSGELWAPTQNGTITGHVATTQGFAVPNAPIRVGAQAKATYTNETGDFVATFGHGDVSDGNLVLVSVDAPDYVKTQTKVSVGTNTTYSTSIIVKAVAAQQTFNTPNQTQVVLSEPAKAVLNIPPASILDANLQPVAEPVTVQLTALDPTNPKERSVFPGGDFLAIDPSNPPPTSEFISLESVVLAEVKLLGASGVEYKQLGTSATLDLALPESQQSQYQVGDTIPLWFYNATTGIWQREGQATVFQDSDGKKWTRASVSHFTWWNVDNPIEQHACIKFTPVEEGTGQSLANLNFYLDGVTYNGRSENKTFGGEKGINGKLSNPVPEKVRLLVHVNGFEYPLQRDNADPGLYRLISDAAQSTAIDLPVVAGSYQVNNNVVSDPGTCDNMGTIRFDLTPPTNGPPTVNLQLSSGAPVTGGNVTVTATITDPDNNLSANPVYQWSTNCGDVYNQTPWNADIYISASTDCEVTLTVQDDMGASGAGSLLLDLPCQPIPSLCPLEVCIDVDVCVDVPVEICEDIPYEVCEVIPYEVCVDIPYEVCEDIPYEVCEVIPYEVCVDIPYEVCDGDGNCHIEYYQDCHTEYYQDCHTEYYRDCRTEYYRDCHTEYYRDCHIEYYRDCHTELQTQCYIENQCHTEWVECFFPPCGE